MHRFVPYILLILLVAPAVAAAQDDDPKALFVQGNAAFNAGDYPEAVKYFRAAYAAKPTWKLLYNIGQAEASAKRYGLALDAFENYLAEGGDEIDNERNTTVLSEIARLRMLVGNLKVEAPAGAELLVDGVPHGTAPFSSIVRVAVGNKTIAVVHDGQVLYEEQVKIAGGVTTVVEAKASSVASAGPSAAPESAVKPDVPAQQDKPKKAGRPQKPREARAPRSKGFPLVLSGAILTGVGGAALVVGAILGGGALSDEASLSERCPEQICVDPTDQNEIDAITGKANAATALLVGGGVVAATGVTLIIIGKRKKETMTAAPVLAPGFGGLTLEGRF